jgi:hypothetical protein
VNHSKWSGFNEFRSELANTVAFSQPSQVVTLCCKASLIAQVCLSATNKQKLFIKTDRLPNDRMVENNVTLVSKKGKDPSQTLFTIFVRCVSKFFMTARIHEPGQKSRREFG